MSMREVLIADDHPLFRDALRQAVASVVVAAKIDDAGSFEELTTLLEQDSDVDLILLDLNLPKMDGREVLAHIKENERLKTIPTVILTTSDAESDIVKSYELQANCYLSKPVQLDAFDRLVKSINEFWLINAKLPHWEHGA